MDFLRGEKAVGVDNKNAEHGSAFDGVNMIKMVRLPFRITIAIGVALVPFPSTGDS